MATVPTPRIWTLNEAPTSATMVSGITDPLTFLMNRPRAHLRRTTTQSIPTSTITPVQFTTEDVDTDPSGTGGHDNSTNPSRWTAVYAGYYQVSGGMTFPANTTGRRGCWWRINGTDLNGSEVMGPATAANPCAIVARTILVYLSVGDYIELGAYQESGVALALSGTTFEQATMTVLWQSN